MELSPASLPRIDSLLSHYLRQIVELLQQHLIQLESQLLVLLDLQQLDLQLLVLLDQPLPVCHRRPVIVFSGVDAQYGGVHVRLLYALVCFCQGWRNWLVNFVYLSIIGWISARKRQSSWLSESILAVLVKPAEFLIIRKH